MAELVDASDSKSDSARSAGSIPARGTTSEVVYAKAVQFRSSQRVSSGSNFPIPNLRGFR